MKMKGSKLVVAALFAAALLFGTNAYAQTFPFVAAGSTGAFNAMAIAGEFTNGGTQTPVCGPFNWTAPSGQVTGHDNRGVSAIADAGAPVWIEWNTSDGLSTGTPTTICLYLSVDSIIGTRLYFSQPRASVNFPGGCPSAGYPPNTPNQVPLLPADVTLTQGVCNALNGQAFNAAPNDARPEDAAFETQRICAAYAGGLAGLGYGGSSNCKPGITISSAFSTKNSQPVAFNISGTDPITSNPIPAYTTLNVGAQAMMILANTLDTASGGLGNAQFANVNRWVLGKVQDGTLTQTRDLIPSSGVPAKGLVTLLREPLSGTYTVQEFSIPRNLEINSSQEKGINPNGAPPSGWTGTTNPLSITFTKSGGEKKRVIGTGEMVKEIGATTNGLGYAFFSYGNVAPLTNSSTPGKYLTVDGVDPLYADYASNPNGPGVLPTCTISAGTSSCVGAITFPNVINGSYPIWNVLTVATASPAPAGVTAMVAAAQTYVTSFVPDFVPFSQLNVFRSHYNVTLNGKAVAAHNGHTKTAEAGGAAGGAIFTVQADLDNITDTNKELTGFKQ